MWDENPSVSRKILGFYLVDQAIPLLTKNFNTKTPMAPIVLPHVYRKVFKSLNCWNRYFNAMNNTTNIFKNYLHPQALCGVLDDHTRTSKPNTCHAEWKFMKTNCVTTSSPSNHNCCKRYTISNKTVKNVHFAYLETIWK